MGRRIGGPEAEILVLTRFLLLVGLSACHQCLKESTVCTESAIEHRDRVSKKKKGIDAQVNKSRMDFMM